MFIKIKLVDYQLMRKFVYFSNYYLFANFFIIFLFYIASNIFDNEYLVIIYIALFVSLIIIMIIYFLLLFIERKIGFVTIYENKLIFKENSFDLSDFCIDINMNSEKKRLLKKNITIKNIEDRYSNIRKYGNYLVNKKTNEKLEFKLPNEKKLLFMIEHIDICISNRDTFKDDSPMELIDGAFNTLWSLS